MPITVTIGGKPNFQPDPASGQYVLTLAQLNQVFDNLTLALDIPDPVAARQVDLTYLDTAFSGLVHSVKLLTLEPGEVVHGVVLKHEAAFTGGGATAVTAEVGPAADLDQFVQAFDVLQAANDSLFAGSPAGFAPAPLHFSQPVDVLLTLRSTGANLSALTTGVVSVYLYISSLWRRTT